MVHFQIYHFDGEEIAEFMWYEYPYDSYPGNGDTHGCGVHPVIKLNNQVLTSNGDGSKEKPYELVIDK